MITYKNPNGEIIKVDGKLFVCKDSHGRDVFAGDETNHGIIVWDIEMFQWHLLENITDILGDKQKIGQEYLLCEYADDIELIEEQ